MTVKELKALLEGYDDATLIAVGVEEAISDGAYTISENTLDTRMEGKDVLILTTERKYAEEEITKAEPEEKAHREGGGGEEPPAGGDAGTL